MLDTSLWAAKRLKTHCKGLYCFPRYTNEERCNSNSASAAINKWIKTIAHKNDVIHGLRHSLRDRLRSIETPPDMIDQLGGWTLRSIGQGYGDSYSLELMQSYYQEEKFKEAFIEASELIDMDVVFAKVLLGALYMHGQHVKKDTIKGLKIWTEAADAGVANAQFNLGITYLNGTVEKIPKNVSKSIKYLEMASNNDHPEACYTLGQIYSDGKHAETNHDLAWKYMSLAESLGNEDAIRWRESMEMYINSMQMIIDIAKSSDSSKKKLSVLEKHFKNGKILEEHYETCKNKILSETAN